MEENNIEFFRFELSLQINKEVDIGSLNYPGVFAVECKKTSRILFLSSENVLYDISIFFDNFLSGKIENDKFLEDYYSYGEKGFKFFVFDAGPESESELKRDLAIYYYQSLSFYKDRLY